MKLTAAEIERGRSPRGGWTRKQLAEWGVPWPPKKGWKKRLMSGEQPDFHESEVHTGPYVPGEVHRAWSEWTWNGHAFVRTNHFSHR